MADRRAFLTRLGVTGLVFASSAVATARAQSSTQPTTTPSAAETPPTVASAQPNDTSSVAGRTSKAPSASAVALAATMRRFDPKLSDDELAKIATEIDENAGAGAVLNPKKRRLKNSDEPITRFAASVR